MSRFTWGIEDPLHRGDDRDEVRLPDPDASESFVRHILYLDGAGRSTPYASTTEDETIAQRFAGSDGAVWHTLVAKIQQTSVRYVSKSELLGLLRRKGMGAAAWTKASEVQQARAYVEQWGEHLVDFRALKGTPEKELRAVVTQLFTKERP
jgi:hypothetical protein